ncbi:hypothetical protein EV182_000508 [Spiromyces aspiralis]|uniref:Uncharacterized protein n=1 Tax=Spiromyces aspiralis TaxID=68401 RepID=A0ACC1HPE3_9FUNG|nr:hypothetical protein EV182_000508 [Spiromyces aspiralis]
MSQIIINYSPQASADDDVYCLLEAQGKIQTSAPSIQGVRIGRLEQAENVGRRELTGKLVKLKNPLALMQKREPPGHDGLADEDASDGPRQQYRPDLHYDVKAVIRHKFLFSSRPDIVIDEKLQGFASFS